MNLLDYDISTPFPAVLWTSERITDMNCGAEVRHLVFDLPPRQKFEFVEGQSIGVLAPAGPEFGNRDHLRLYSIASPRHGEGGHQSRFSLCVRRCFYIDKVSGERYPGTASNYLCDLQPGDSARMTGPYRTEFNVPDDPTANLLMIGVGTGIAPFRAFVRHIYDECGGWKGKVRLFFGANTGMELLYRNEVKRDLGLYYDNSTFKAFEAVSPKPHFDAPPAIDRVIQENAAEVWELVQDPKTHVFVAGLIDVENTFFKAMAAAALPGTSWKTTRDNLIADGRYAELLYE